MNKTLAIIPARGGSKRIPGKNIKKFMGKEIIYYPISTALKAQVFDDVVVSTDDKKIKQISESYGASVPFFRSDKNSDDYATTFEVVKEVIDNLQEEYTYICCLYPTSVFVEEKNLVDSRKELIDQERFSSIISVVKYSHPVQRRLYIEEDRLKIKEVKNYNSRSQDLLSFYHDAAQFYFGKLESVLKEEKLITKEAKPYIFKDSEVQDIDNEEDWKIAELKYRLKRKNSHA